MDAEKMMMQREIDNLRWLLDRVERERDALKRDLLSITVDGYCSCSVCKYFSPSMTVCKHTEEIGAEDIGECFEWRGLCKENGGAEDGI